MPKVVVARHIGEEALGIIRAVPEIELVLWLEDRVVDRKWLLDNVKGATGVLVMLSQKVDEELLDQAGPSLKVVSTMSVGYEHVDLQALSARGVKLGFTPDVLTDAVADISIMLALMASRNALSALQVVESGKWPSLGWTPFGFCGPQLGSGPTLPWPNAPAIGPSEFTAGFLGFGRISKAVLHRLIPFGITRAVYTTSGRGNQKRDDEDQELVEKYKGFGSLKEVKRVDLDELARQSDVLFTLVPGGSETYHIISTDFLSKMKPTSILINTGRGTIVDSHALAEALNNNQLYAAGLDVIEGEPDVDIDHPLVKCPKAVVLPHIASATTQTRLAMSALAAKNLVAGVLGEDLPVELKL